MMREREIIFMITGMLRREIALVRLTDLVLDGVGRGLVNGMAGVCLDGDSGWFDDGGKCICFVFRAPRDLVVSVPD